jgi:outer membrane protein assembly factor BamB
LNRKIYRLNLSLLSALVLASTSACSALPEWWGEKEPPPVSGKRLSVMELKQKLTSDPTIATLSVAVGPEKQNANWLMQRNAPFSNLAFTARPSIEYRINVGSEPNEPFQLTSAPIIASGIIFTLDGEGNIEARRIENPENILWQVNLSEEKASDTAIARSIGVSKSQFVGGNLSSNGDVLYVTTVSGDVVAIKATTGNILWTRELKIPIRSAALVQGKSVYVITSENELHAISAENGTTRWVHQGLPEKTSIFGGATPVKATDNVLIVPYSSGELYALNSSDGKVLWAGSLASNVRRGGSLFTLNDIDASPLVQNGVVYGVSHEGVLAADDVATGKRIWQQEVSSLYTPWFAGGMLFIVTTDNELVAVHAGSGKIKWVSPLAPMLDDSDDEPTQFSGPVLAGGQLWITASSGHLLALSPQNGKLVSNIDISEDNFLPPVVAGGKMYLLDNEANLTILR